MHQHTYLLYTHTHTHRSVAKKKKKKKNPKINNELVGFDEEVNVEVEAKNRR